MLNGLLYRFVFLSNYYTPILYHCKTRNFGKESVLLPLVVCLILLIFINEVFENFPYSQPMIGLRSRALQDMTF